MKKSQLILLLFLLVFPLSIKAQNTFDITAVASWQELPSSPAMWKSNTNYKVSSSIVVTSAGVLPDNSQICVIGNGHLQFKNSNITCGQNGGLYVVGGKMSLMNSKIKMGNGFSLIEGELGIISLQNSTLSLGERSIMTINGRALEGSGSKIEGNSTSLVAPIKKIFSKGVDVGGKWIIDRAYPQWFEDNSKANWAIAINKAIKMKGTGEVFLPRGQYTISSSIYVSYGIKLVGETGRDTDTPNSDYTNIIPSTGATSFNGGYMMLVNIKHQDSNGKEIEVNQESAQWEVHYPNTGTQLQSLTFTCTGNQRYKGILVAGGIFIDQLTWRGCLQGVAFASHTYDDQRIVTNSTFYCAGDKIKMSGRQELYAFDFNSLGDALVFTGNAVHNSDRYTKALRLFMCYGGNVCSNVLNGDVLIKLCKGISFSSNHCEYGHTVTIQSSTVVNNSNFYEKGEAPTIIITNNNGQENSSVTINGDQFVYYDGKRSYSGVKESNEEAAARLRSISEYDIAADAKTQLTLNNTYRYDIPMKVGVGSQNIFGVQLANVNKKGEFEPNKSFNRYSHRLSKSGKMGLSNKTDNSFRRLSPGKSRIYLYGRATATWLGETGDYSYSYEILDDNGRVSNQNNSMPSYVEKDPIIHLDKGGDGILFCLKDTAEAGNNLYVRLKRRGADGTKTVEFPLAGTIHIYDNGISVSGYKWK